MCASILKHVDMHVRTQGPYVPLQPTDAPRLYTDRVMTQIGVNRINVLRHLYIKDWNSEPKHQHQNYCERRWQNIKHNTTNLMNKLLIPGFAWLLALTFVCQLMNCMAVESLAWHAPLHVLTGQKPDISPFIQYRFWEDVYFRNYYASNTLAAEDETAGWFVGIAENVGHSLTFKVLSKETMQMYTCSSLRRATSGRNERADERARLALAARGYDLRGLPIKFDDDGNQLTLDQPLFTFGDTACESMGKPRPAFDPTSLIGRTFLKPTDDNGDRQRMKIVGIVDPDDPSPALTDHLKHPEVLRLRCIVNKGEEKFEELVVYNEILHLLEDKLEDGYWHFEEIVGHEGPLREGHPRYKNSMSPMKQVHAARST